MKERLAFICLLVNGFDDIRPDELFWIKFTALVISTLEPLRTCVLAGVAKVEFASTLRVEAVDWFVAVSMKECSRVECFEKRWRSLQVQ